MDSLEAAIPAVALAIGFIGALLTEWLRDGRAVRRERKRRVAEAQRQTLLELQDAMQQLARAAGSLYTARRRRLDDGGGWLKSQEFLVHHESVLEARMTVVTLASRVEDSTLRGLVDSLRAQEAALTDAETAEAALTSQAGAGDALTEALEHAGALLRSPG